MHTNHVRLQKGARVHFLPNQIWNSHQLLVRHSVTAAAGTLTKSKRGESKLKKIIAKGIFSCGGNTRPALSQASGCSKVWLPSKLTKNDVYCCRLWTKSSRPETGCVDKYDRLWSVTEMSMWVLGINIDIRKY